ncbi:MAG: hypothetical protein U0414_27690 [Polyangiaceae bacterium]
MRSLRTGSLFALVVGTLLLVACDDGAPGTSSTSSSSTGGASASASVTVGAGGAMPNVTGLIETAGFTVNCQPVVKADPVTGSFSAKYVNAGDLDGEVDIVGAQIVFTLNANKLTWAFDVTPTASGAVPAGGSTDVTHTKVDDSGAGSPMNPCDFCAGTARLEVTWKAKTIQQVGEKSLGLVQCLK